MGGMSTPKPKEPRVVRMPNEEDPAALAAAKRRQEATLERKGRLSTILTDQNQGRAGLGSGAPTANTTIGSSGKTLGA
jgi:hypothetical protein